MPWKPLPNGVGHVYALLEPDCDDIRYVGQTYRDGGAPARLSRHMINVRRSPNNHTHLFNWLRKLEHDGLRPRVQILAVVPVAQLNECEKYWIARLRELGCDLTNSTAGGTGGPIRLGMKTPPETIAKQSANRRKKRRPETIERMRAWKAQDRESPRSCIVCRDVFWGYMGLRNHQPRHKNRSL